VNADTTVIFDKPELSEAVHDETYTRPGGSDHFCQRFLCVALLKVVDGVGRLSTQRVSEHPPPVASRELY